MVSDVTPGRPSQTNEPVCDGGVVIVLIGGAYLLDCRVSEIAVVRWKALSGKTSRLLMTEARFTASAKDRGDALSAYRQQRSTYFMSLAAVMRTISSSLVPAVKDTSRTMQWEMFVGNGTSRRLPRSLAPTEAQPRHTGETTRSGCIHAQEHPLPFIWRDDW